MNKKKIYLITALMIIIILVGILATIGEKKYDPTSPEITKLYQYLGNIDINKCGGLQTYTNKVVSASDISIENKLCMAYYNLNSKKIINEEKKYTEVNNIGTKICKIGDKITLTANNKDNTMCNYNIVDKDDIALTYKNIYGLDIEKHNDFSISGTNTCYIEGNQYYCGEGETYTYTIGADATIYRLINKAVKNKEQDIIIYDYFLKISNNTCYLSTNNDTNDECTKELKNNKEITEKLVKKYGKLYKHTFKLDENNNYYWSTSEPK